MKKLLKLLLVPILSLTIAVSASTSTFALGVDCENITISNTGPGSTNTVNCSDETTVTISCANNTTINIDVTQEANSGVAVVNGNTNAGSAISGGANNVIDTIAEVDSACELATATTPKPTTPTTPVTPATVTPAKPTKTASLPNTGEMTSVMKAGLVSASVVALLAVTRFGVMLYSKYSSN